MKIDWGKYIKEYGVPSIAKEKILKPFFDKDFDAPILDLGCGKGYFSHLLAKRGLRVVGVDLNATLDNQKNFTFIQSDLLDFSTKEKFKTIFLINVLSTITTGKHIAIFKKIKEFLDDKKGRAIVLNMNFLLYERDFKSSYLQVRKIEDELGELDFTLVDGSHRFIRDFILNEDEIIEVSKKAGLRLLERTQLGVKNDMPIYNIYTFES